MPKANLPAMSGGLKLNWGTRETGGRNRINGGGNMRKPLRCLVFPLIALLLVSSITYAGFFDSLELSLEKEIGHNAYEEITTGMKVVKLPATEEERLQAIFRRLVNVSERKKELQYTLTVVEDNTVNAFALPGGYIFVHTGLLAFAESDGEIAGVLAHEIAHVDRKHGMSRIKRQLGMAFLLQLILKKSEAKEELGKIGAIAINLTQLGYGREAEYEADRYGVYFMEKAGFARKEVLNFWERILEQTGGKENPAFLQLFSTHPPTSERIKRIKAL